MIWTFLGLLKSFFTATSKPATTPLRMRKTKDEICWACSRGISHESRLWICPDGEVIYYKYDRMRRIDETWDLSRMIWLTCSPEKYGYMKDPDNQYYFIKMEEAKGEAS